ncbi:sperm-associated antigen 5 [Thunnus albacares]|uniref:sperm-associated antigen 5 n=1 Tax=Thunnus albacares TaxID=8236 RepID=UPI001CF6B1F1|nr:sperm-associated antigen 5 [Thunnus albacares]
MSSRKSSSSRQDSPSSRSRQRTPMRSLENEWLHLSTPSSRFKSKSRLSTDFVKTSKGDVPPCDPEPHLPSPPTKVIQTNAPSTDNTACGLGDVTFKSFICAGGEVEISCPSECAGESIVLLKDQTMNNTCESEDTAISESMIVQSCNDHIEHPYHNPERRDASSVDIDAERPCEIQNISLASGDLDGKQTTQEFKVFQEDWSRENDVTWKSFVCDGGEVVVSDVTRLQDETIPLPKGELGELLQDNSVNSSIVFDCGQLCQAEHADHPYSSSEKCVVPVITHLTTFSETQSDSEKPGLSDVTFKSFNCTGGEIEISDGTKMADETVPLPADQTATSSESCNHGIDPSALAGDDDDNDHLDHPYCNTEKYPPTLSGDLPKAQEPCSPHALEEVEPSSLVVPEEQTGRQDGVTFGSFISTQGEGELSGGIQLTEKTSPLLKDQAVICQLQDDNNVPTHITQDHIQDNYEQSNSHVENDEAVLDADPPAVSASSLINTSLKALDNEPVQLEVQQTPQKHSMHADDSALPSLLHKTESADCSNLVASAETLTPGEVQQHPERDSQMHSSRGPSESSEAKDSALGSSGNGPLPCNAVEIPRTETLPDVLKVLSECPSVASVLQLGILSPVIRRASLSVFKAQRDLEKDQRALDQFLMDDSALDGEKSFLAPANVDPRGLWAEHLESPMPRPLFNSTALGFKSQPGAVTEPADNLDVKPCAALQSEAVKPVLDIPMILDGPLQQQLRQMAEFLILASGKMDPTAVSAPFSGPVPPPAAPAVTSARATPAESHSICVGTSPVKLVDHSLNTSGQFERKREFSVDDACTLTDPLLWNVPAGSLECLPREELEQRLRSSMIMVEALVQQLAVARAHGSPSVGPAPSELREKLVQTDHTELSQTTMYRGLYMEALSRIGDLELDGSSLQNLIQCMQDMRVTMTSLSCDTDAALSNMKEMGDIVREDHQSLASHYGEMRSLFEKSKETQTRMMQKVKDVLQQRDNMQTQMEEAFNVKEAALNTMEQLRRNCATEISELQKSVGSQQELLDALKTTYPEQVALNKVYTEIMDSASGLLSQTVEEQSRLMQELCTVRGLLRKTTPMLMKLNEKAVAALRERDEYIAERDQAVEEREQIEEELNQANLNLQNAREQIGDFNLQVTILTSEMGVLRQKLTERDEERAQLERKVTELSATVSSTLASYTFLEQALGAETTKLQESWKDIQQSKDRAAVLETSLDQSEQRVRELSQALAQSEEQLGQLQELSQSQSTQIQQLQDVCTQLSNVQEMNEFLQMENELVREQVADSEQMLKANLQSLRERNIQCEDLKAELGQLQIENKSLQEELETTRVRASTTQLELREKLAQAVTEITLLHHTLRGLTNQLHAALNEEKSEPRRDKESQPVNNVERRHPSSSFIDSIMVALTAEKEEDLKTETPAEPVPSDMAEPQCDTLFSETSAFTRIAAVTPKKNLNAAEFEPEEEQSNAAELLADLGSTVTELVSTLKLLQQRKNAQLEELHNTICGLQVEQQAANTRHEAEVSDLKHQLSRFNRLVEKGNQALQQKTQDEKTIMKLMADINEAQDLLTKHKTDNNELRKDVVELRRSLQQSQVESQFLREELRKAGGQSAKPAHFMEEKIQLLKEVERLKLSVQEVEQARGKLLERAKRHQIIYQTNQQKSENELLLLNTMINKVRETLLSLPDAVKNCEQLQRLVEYIG